jgi:hypothetical protein
VAVAVAPTHVDAQATAIAPYFLVVVDNSWSIATAISDYVC